MLTVYIYKSSHLLERLFYGWNKKAITIRLSELSLSTNRKGKENNIINRVKDLGTFPFRIYMFWDGR